jgi:hypothetical protein
VTRSEKRANEDGEVFFTREGKVVGQGASVNEKTQRGEKKKKGEERAGGVESGAGGKRISDLEFEI